MTLVEIRDRLLSIQALDPVLPPASLVGGATILYERRIETEKTRGVTGRIAGLSIVERAAYSIMDP